MASNSSLRRANAAKQDEYYTRLSDIEKEMRYYKSFFVDKVVMCNCDDPFESNFFKYFALNFNALKLKRLITTCYATSPIVYTQLSMFGNDTIIGEAPTSRKPYVIDISEIKDLNGDGRM